MSSWLAHGLVPHTADQWSALGSMLGGIGSVAAVLGAVALLLHEMRERREDNRRYAQERREQEERLRDEEARQARLIIGEMGPTYGDPESDGNELLQLIDVTNHSDAFVFDVVVRIPGIEQRQLLHYVKPGESERAAFHHVPDGYFTMHVGCGGPSTPYQLRVTLEFTDSCGRRWRRNGWEEPVRLAATLADPGLYRHVPPTPRDGHPYDKALKQLGLFSDA